MILIIFIPLIDLAEPFKKSSFLEITNAGLWYSWTILEAINPTTPSWNSSSYKTIILGNDSLLNENFWILSDVYFCLLWFNKFISARQESIFVKSFSRINEVESLASATLPEELSLGPITNP